MWLPLRWQFVIVLLIGTLPAVAYSIYAAALERREQVGNAVEAVDRLALAASAVHREVIQGSRYLLEGLAALPPLRGAPGPACSQILENVRARFAQYEVLAVVDPAGMPRCVSSPDIGRVDASQGWFREALAQQAFTVGPYTINPASHRPVVVAAVPVAADDGDAIGLLIAAISLDWIERLATDIELPPKSHFMLLDSEENVIARYPATLEAGRALPPRDELARLLATGQDAFAGTGADDTGRFYGVAPLQETGIRLILAVPQEIALSSMHGSLGRYVGSLIGIWLLALIAAWFAADQLVTKWLRSLSRTAAAISAGDLTARPAVPRIAGELRQLARVFGLMADRIRGREENLRRALREREVLIKEIYHRVKNNLQLINSLLNLQLQGVESAEVRQRLEEAQARVQAMSVVHNRLYAGDDLANVDQRQLFKDVCDQLSERHGAAARGVQCSIDVPARPIDIDRAIPLALLTTEAVMNSLKHAFPGRDAGAIHISMREEAGAAVLRIGDDGVGLPGSPETYSTTGALGLKLIRALAGQLGAKLDVVGPPGVTYVLRFDRDRLAA